MKRVHDAIQYGPPIYSSQLHGGAWQVCGTLKTHRCSLAQVEGTQHVTDDIDALLDPVGAE